MTELATFGAVVRATDTHSGRIIWEGTLLGTGGGTLTAGRPPLMDVSSNAIQMSLTNMFRQFYEYRETAN